MNIVRHLPPQKMQGLECFGDVVICDDTHKTNRFNLPYFGLQCVDRNNKTVVVCQGVIIRQDIPAYSYVFEFAKRQMGGLEPKTFFSDGDHAIAAAIKAVFPTSKHRLCMWHFKGTYMRPPCCGS